MSESEKRKLHQIPLSPLVILRDSGRHKFEEAFKDQYGFRDHLTSVHNHLKFRLLGISPNPKVILGKDGWLFYNGSHIVEDMTHGNLLSPTELSDWVKGFIAKRDWLKVQEVDYLFMIAPNKHGIHADKLKFELGTLTRRTQLTAELQNGGVADFLDLYEPLKAMAEDRRLYRKTDTHWNDWGANLAQYELMVRVGKRFPKAISPQLYKETQFSIEKRHEGDLAQMIGLQTTLEETVPVFQGNTNYHRVEFSSGIPEVAMPDRTPVVKTTNRASIRLKVLCFRDSFFSNMIQYLSSYPVDVTYVWLSNPTRRELSYWVERVAPDIVIEETVERLLPTFIEFATNKEGQDE